jgi:zinc protease
MTRRMTTAVLLLSTFLFGTKLKDPRKMEFPARLDFTAPEVERCTLSNGVEVFFIQDHEFPLVDITFSIRAGERRVDADYAGLAEILADLVVEGGSKAVSNRVFQDSLENFGATLSTSSGSRNTDFTLHLLSEHIPALLPLVVGAVREPALPAEQLEINKNQRLISYQGRNDEPTAVAERIYQKLYYGPQNVWARETTPEVLDRIDLDALGQFHHVCYRPSLTMIGVAGDFDPDVMLEQLERYLGDWQEPEIEPYEEAPFYGETAPPGIYLVHRPGSVQSSIFIVGKGLQRDDPRYPATLLFNDVYGGAWFSRLRKELRVERGLAYSAYGYINSLYTEHGVFATICLTKSESTLQAIRLIHEIMEDLGTEGITQNELKLAKSSWLAGFPKYYAEPEYVLSDRMNYALHDYPVDFWDRIPDRIEPLTVEDVNRVAADFIKLDSLIIIVVGDSTAFDGYLSELGEVTIIDPEKY